MQEEERRPVARRLTGDRRRRQLLETARRMVREEGADRLTLGTLASRAGVSKPVAYEHFGTRSGLLVALYRSIDEAHSTALQTALASGGRNLPETAALLARSYVRCAADTDGEWSAVGAALAGDPARESVYRELIAGYVELFFRALRPHVSLDDAELRRRCVGLVGAAESLSAALTEDRCTESEAAGTLTELVLGGMRTLPEGSPEHDRSPVG